MTRPSGSDHVHHAHNRDRLISVDEVTSLTGLSRTTIWRKETAGDFPNRLRISANRVGYRLGAVLDWIQSLPGAAVARTS